MLKIPKEYSSVSKTFRIPSNLIGEMEFLAVKRNISLNKVVELCLQYAMDNLDTSDDETPPEVSGE